MEHPPPSPPVDPTMLEQLESMGVGHWRAVRALTNTHSCGIDAAFAWIAEHENDEDIDEPLAAAVKSTLSPEEASAQALALQEKLRQRRAEREKEEEKIRERERVESTKKLLEAKRLMEESERKRAVEEVQRQKRLAAEEQRRQRELLRREYEERFGKPYEEQHAEQLPQSAKDRAAYFVNQIRNGKDRAAAMQAFALLEKYLSNVSTHPDELKFRKINKENANVASKLVPVPGAVELLEACGFAHAGNFLVMDKPPDLFVLNQALRFISIAKN